MPRLLFALLIVLGLVACQSPSTTPAPTTSPPGAPQPPTTVPGAVPTASPSPTRAPAAAPAPSPSAVSASAPSVAASRVDVLNAAAAAYANGDPSAAAALYERVINTPPPTSEGATAQTITDFATLESVITLLAAGREDDARTQLDALQARDSSAPLARIGAQVWDQYSMTGGLRGACAQLQPQIGQAAPAIAALQAVGVTVDAASLCRPPTG